MVEKHRITKALAFALLILGNTMPSSVIFAQSAQNNSTKSEIDRLEQEKQTREQRVKALEQNADNAVKEVNELQQRLVQAAVDRDKAERNVEKSVTKLATLRQQEQIANNQLLARREALENVVVALIAIEQDRPPALAVKPQNATEAARVAILMRLIAPQLNARAQQISSEIGNLRQLRENILMSNDEYRKANTYLQNSKQTIAVLIAQRRLLEVKLRKDAEGEKQVIAQIAAKAQSLRDLISRVGEAVSNMGSNLNGSAFARNFESQKGSLTRPVLGITMQNYGARLSEGGTASGMTIRTRQAAQVMSPYDGKVEFSAPFRSYGKVVIINVGGDYRVVLAGMGEVYVEAGQEILAGEPIGEMAADGRVIPDLYVEFRKGNTTFNPSPWFRKDTNG